MGNETVYDVAVIDNRRRIESAQTVVEARLAADGEITKVLSVSATASVYPAETLNGEARYRGKVCYKALYLDGSTPRALDYVSEFSGAILSDRVKTNTVCAFRAELLDIDVSAVTNTEIKAAAVVEITLIATESENLRYLSAAADGVYTREERLAFQTQTASVSSSFTETDVLENLTVRNVVSAEAKAITVKRAATDDAVEISGEAICDLVCEGEDGLLVSLRSAAPFTEVIAAHGVAAGDIVTADVILDGVRVNLTEGEETTVEIVYELTATACAYRENTLTAVTDAFSVENELLKTGEGVSIVRVLRQECVRESLDGTVQLKDDMPPADNILAVCGAKAVVTSTVSDSGRVLAGGMVTGNIIYYCAENNSVSAASVELPFSLLLSVNAGEGDAIEVHAEAVKSSVRIRRGNELDFRAEVCFDVTVSGEETAAVLVGLETGEPRPRPDCAFSVYIARRGDTLWEAAKELGVTPEAVIGFNPDVVVPLSGGERLVAYRHLAGES